MKPKKFLTYARSTSFHIAFILDKKFFLSPGAACAWQLSSFKEEYPQGEVV
jgi:hypothetical protein